MKRKPIYYLLICLLAVACSGPQKEKPAENDTPAEVKVVGQEVSYSSDSATLNGYLAFDQNNTEKVPGILVVHEWWGHNDYARMRAEMLAELGYVALAVDMYGDGKLAEHPDDAQQFMMAVIGNIEGAKARFESAMETLKDHPNVDGEKIGAIGYCFGGSVVLSMANAGYDLDAVASFHGGLGLPIMPETGGVKAKILVANGAADPFITAEQIEAYKAAMDAAEADYEFISYEGALHSFTSKEADALGEKFEMPVAYDAAADSASWAEMQALFKEVF